LGLGSPHPSLSNDMYGVRLMAVILRANCVVETSHVSEGFGDIM